jgi:natural product precursor
MKTQNTKLTFSKKNIVELNNTQLLDVKGGSTSACWVLITILLTEK